MTTDTTALPLLERPRPTRSPEVQRRLEEAFAQRQEGEQIISRADDAEGAAKHLNQRIGGLHAERDEVQKRLVNIEGQDLNARLEVCRATVRRFFGIPGLAGHRPQDAESLNSAALALAWIPEVAKEIPAIVASLKNRLAEIAQEIETLEKN